MGNKAVDPGKLISVHGISPAYLQRAAFVTVLSFVFFLAMMFGFYFRQNLVYFLLASAFLLIYLLTLFGWLLQKRNHLKIFEKGFSYKKDRLLWEEIRSISPEGEIETNDARKILLPKAIQDFDIVVNIIKRNLLPE